MTIRHLRVFLEVASCNSMSHTAEKLHFSQSTISQIIKDLEVCYGTLLFERLSKRLYITESGRILQRYAKKVVSEFDTLQSVMSEQSSIEHIRLGATITCGCCILPQLLKDFQLMKPDVDLISFIYNTHVIEEKILLGEMDIALVEGNVQSDDIIFQPIMDDHLVLAFSSDHEFAHRTSFTAMDLEGRDFVVREKGSGTRARFDNYLAKHGIDIHRKVEAPFPEAMKHAIMYNNCLAVLSERLLKKEIESKEIFIMRLDTDEWNRHFSLVYHKDKYISNSIKLIADLLAQYQRNSFNL